jgi:hypothetical protein
VKTKTVLAWRNKLSGETGYVKTVSKKNGYFINTFDAAEAKSYRSNNEIMKDLELLKQFGEFDRNMFESLKVAVQ